MSARNEKMLQDLIAIYGLQPHPEGGYFRETYSALEKIEQSSLASGFGGERPYSTAIYYLLPTGEKSRWHRIKSDEVWHFYLGDPLTIYEIDCDGEFYETKLGANIFDGQRFQSVVPAGNWFGALHVHSKESDYGFSLVGCTVAPGFHFDEFELANGSALREQFPDLAEKILLLE